MNLTITTADRKPIYGKRLMLEKSSQCHASFLNECYSSDDFMDCYRLAQTRNSSVEQIAEQLKNEQGVSSVLTKRVEWIIRKYSSKDDKKGELIGIASLADYQPAHNRAELLVGVLHPEDRTLGYGLEASLLVLEFAFHQAKIHKLVSFVYSYNGIAQKNTLHLGFKQEGVLRDHYFNHGTEKFIDLYQNSLLEEEFFSSGLISKWSKRFLNRDITLVKQQSFTTQLLSKKQLQESFNTALKHGLINQNDDFREICTEEV